ncbi:MAG: triose-phosphate isomerase family protein [Pseudolysinimonas sp.]|uniref:triose-phosphate isomerase family protein n=1 Tax=Pseudolysinimonas sp. TaxID=2680009 RepID=UPI003C723C97
MRTLRIGVSLKAYFGYRASISWLEAAIELAAASPAVRDGSVEVFLAPSTPLLETAVRLSRNTPIVVCAQDCSVWPTGAHTGETTAELLAEMGVSMVELGHAERRRDQGETDAVIARKTEAATLWGLTPLICVGEPERGTPADAARVCLDQLTRTLEPAAPALIAYEPVWAIGADHPADPGYVSEVATALREHLGDREQRPILYGGSAGPGLLHSLGPAVDGLFLGRFAHDIRNFDRVLDEAAAAVA